jgi:hypothetical protein
MARRKKSDTPIEESIRLSSEVTIIVRAAPAVYDSLDIRRVGGVVTVALPNSLAGAFESSNVESRDTPIDPVAIAAARARLGAAKPSAVVTPETLGFPPLTPETLAGGTFVGTSNEDTDA